MHYLCYDTALNEEFALIRLLQTYKNNRSLFYGTDDERIWDAAPWLFEVRNNFYFIRDKNRLARFDRCIVFETAEPLADAVQFLQSFMYKEINNRLAYFRVWDAGVLLNTFKDWDLKEQQKFFEVFQCFYTENENRSFFDRWKNGRNGLISERVLKQQVLPDEQPRQDEEEEQPELEPLQQPDKKEDDLEKKEPMADPVEEKPKRRRFFIE